MDAGVEMITILGHTAAGKTALAAQIAHALDGEVISADSRQVYRGMTIGTGKDYEDYQVGGSEVPFHLVDIIDAGREYSVYNFQSDFLQVYREIRERGHLPVMCGGSGLYLESVLKGYRMAHVPVDEKRRKELENMGQGELVKLLAGYSSLHNTTDTVTKKRTIRAIEIAEFEKKACLEEKAFPSINSLNLGICFERENRRKRITERLKQRLEQGMVGEVEALLRDGVGHDRLEFYGLEYKFLSYYLLGNLSYDEMFRKLNTAIHRFSKRQMTWFRGMERRGVKIHWIAGELPMEEKVERVIRLYRRENH